MGWEDSPLQIKLDKFGMFKAFSQGEINPAHVGNPLAVCPFSEEAPDEDKIGADLFAPHGKPDSQIGYHLATYAGYVAEGAFRIQGSSGGLTSWLLCELLNRKWVDHVIHVRPRVPNGEDPRLFSYQISSTVGEVRLGAKSHYYPIEMSEVLRRVRQEPGRYVLVGLPCFVKAVRLLSRNDPIMAQRIRFCVGLFCGHLKSTGYAEALAWQRGIEPSQIRAVNFRKKLPGRAANDYCLEVTAQTAQGILTQTVPAAELFGSDWGLGFFKYKACDYCDDICAEVADISVGDAWLEKYVRDSGGTSIAIVRHPMMLDLLTSGLEQKRLVLEPLAPQSIVESQASGFRHRRAALAYRLFLADRQRRWHPPKRVKPKWSHLTRLRRRITRLRVTLAESSHTAWQQARTQRDFAQFEASMHPLVKEYQKCYGPPWPQRFYSRAQWEAKLAFRRAIALWGKARAAVQD